MGARVHGADADPSSSIRVSPQSVLEFALVTAMPQVTASVAYSLSACTQLWIQGSHGVVGEEPSLLSAADRGFVARPLCTTRRCPGDRTRAFFRVDAEATGFLGLGDSRLESGHGTKPRGAWALCI